MRNSRHSLNCRLANSLPFFPLLQNEKMRVQAALSRLQPVTGPSLIDAGEIKADDKKSIVQAILKREELGSTGIGRGVAVPHTKHPSAEQLTGTVGVSADGVDFNSLDGGKVQLFFLLVSPPDLPQDHLRALENISRQL